MKRRQFLQHSASVAGISFVGCGLGAISGCTEDAHGARREVSIAGKRIRTVDIHCHSYVHDVWPLIQDHSDLGYLVSVVDNPILKNKLDINNVDFRLQQMDEQGIDVQALSLHVGQYHHWADPDLAAKIVAVQNEKIAEACAAHPDRFVGLGAVALQHPDLAVKQMKHAVKALDMRGFMITGSVNGEEVVRPQVSSVLGSRRRTGNCHFHTPAEFSGGTITPER